jgi:hypothetical protein
MPITLDPSTLEQVLQGEDDTVIALPGESIVNIDAITARRKVTSYIGREINLMMGGTEAALVYSKGRLVWRVPVILTSPFRGQIGVVGVVDVDARTGELLLPKNLEATLRTNAHALLEDSPHSPKS